MTTPGGRSRDPITIWHRLLRGYGPFLLLAALALGMAVFVPSRVPKATEATASGGRASSVDGGSTDGTTGGTTVVGSDGAAAGDAGSGGGGGGGALPAGVHPCPDRQLQVPNDPYSPACLAFSGDNGGATTRGVTAKEIHISMRRTQDASFNDALAGIVGAGIVDTPEDVERTTQVLVDYFNEHFQLYGRKIVLDWYDGQGSLGNELVGNGRDKAEVDATKVAEEIQPFGDLTTMSEPYGDALSRRKVMNFGTPVLSREWYSARRPYAWSVLPDCSTLTEEATEFVLKRLHGGNADFAAGDLKGKPRKITVIAPENSWYQECVRAATAILKEAGTDWDVAPISYKIDLVTMSNQAANLVPRLKSQGVTTILCGCDPIFPIFISGTANRERYYPEFVSGYEQDFIGQLWDSTFQKQSFGISPLGPNNSQAPQDTYGYAAFKSMTKEEPARAVDAVYYQLYLLVIGIQGAGPHLTPETFEQGMFDLPGAPRPCRPVGLRAAGLHPHGRLPRVLLGPRRRLDLQRQARHLARPPPGEALPARRGRDGARSPLVREVVTATVDRLVQRLPSARVLVALAVAAYGFAYVLPGTGDWLGRDAPIAVVVIGVVYGTVTALGAMALILTYRATRFVNFAYGAMGSLVGVLSIGLYREHGVPYWLALPIGVAGGVVLGALIDILVLRRFKDASRLVVTVASIGLAQVLGGIEVLGSKAVDFVGLTPAFDVPFDVHWDLGVKVLGGDEMLIVLVAPVVLMALAWFLLRTDHGTAVRAAAENTDRAMLLGIPVRRNTTIVWMLAGGLAALAFILEAPFTGFAPGVATTGPSVLLPALAAAVVARMESLPVALGAGIGLGIIEQVARWNTSGSPSFVDALFLVVIVLALLVPRRGRSPVREGATSSWSAVGSLRPIPEQLRRLPEVRASLAGGVALLVVLAVVVPRGWSADDQLLAAFALVWAMVGVSLVILTGWGGNISLGQFGLVGVGALVAGNLIADQNLDLIFVLVLAGAAGALVALVIGLPALRIGSLLLAVTTIAFAVALDSYVLNVNNFPELVPSNVPRPLLFGRYDLEDQYAMYVLCLVVLVVWITVAVGLRKARTGRTLMATRDNERAAAAAGVEPTRAKLGGFLLAGTIAGVAGALHVQLLHSLSPGSYPVNDSITVFSTAVIGGLGSLAGAVSGVLLFKYLETVQALGDLRLILTGTGLLVVLYALPGGLGQLLGGLRDRLFARIAARRGIDLVAPAADGTMAALGAAATAAASDEAEEEAAVAAQRHGPISADAALSCRGLDLGYGSLQVVRGFDFDVARGELVALLGTNGAGKSTVLKGISGLLPPTAGEIALHGERSTGEAADVLARRGLALVPGGHSTFPSLTVAENLRLAGWMLRHDQAQLAAKTAEVLELFPALAARIDLPAGALSGGEQQMLGLAGALITSPDVLMIDELSLGLAPTVVAELLDVVRRINEAGTTVVIVEQSVNVALELAARAVFMEKGQVRFEGPTGELLSRPDLLRSVFIEGGTGGSAPEAKRPAAARAARAAEAERATEPPELVARSIVKRYGGITAVDGVDLAVRRGEILGLIGHNGAGKTTLLDCLSGFTALDGGRIELRGVDITQLAPPARAHLGLGRSFQDARLYPSLTVAETVAVALERHVSCRSALADGLQLPASFESELVIAERVDELLELMGLLSLRHRPTGELSTGTRRIVDLACTLAQEPAVVLLDEPSSGVGQRETEALTGLLLQVKERTGCAMVVIEHDMPLLRSISDRMVALELGAVIAEGAPADVLAHPAVIASYLGTDEAVIHRSGTRARKRKPKPPAKQATAR